MNNKDLFSNFDGSKIRIRPSSIDGFYTCAFQWAQVFLNGRISIPSARAAIGTAVHAAVEDMWTDAMISKKKDCNLSKANDAGIAAYQEIDQDLYYDKGENSNTAEATVLGGVKAFIDDIVPYTDIPSAVEQRFTVALDNPIVEDISGTVDYIAPGVIADVKTSKRKPVPSSFVVQQTTYKILAEANGHDIKHNLIQGVVLKIKPDGHILEMTPQVDRTKYLINKLLGTLEVFHDDMIDPSILFRPNTKHYLCSPKYCALYGNGCPATSSNAQTAVIKPKL